MKNGEKKKETNERKPERGKVVPRALMKKKKKQKDDDDDDEEEFVNIRLGSSISI